MSQALGEIDRAAVERVQQDAVPLAERWGADPDVDNEVDEGPAQGCHVLGLRGRHVGKVHAADRAPARHGHVGLDHVQAVPDGFGEPVPAE